MFYDLLSIGERPKFMEKYYEYLRYGTAGLITLVVILLIIVLIVLWIKTYLENIQGFEISAVLAIVAEIILFACWKNGSKPEYITNTMLDSLANNWFAAGLVLGFVFLVLQIMIIIGIDLLFKGLGFDDKSILDLGIEERILSIEKKMIKLALGIIEGCVSLFDFIPDFFVTIGALVFDKKESGEKGDK